MIVRRLLERETHPFEVEAVTTGTEAHQRLSAGGFDCLVLDHMLPDTNSLEFLREVKERYGTMPVVVVTGQKHDWIHHSSLELGASQCLSKDEVLEGTLSKAILEAITAAGVEPEGTSPPQTELRSEGLVTTLEARFETLLNTMRGGVITLDGRGNITFCNPQSGELLGNSSEQLLGRTLEDFLTPEQAQEHQSHHRAIQAGEANYYELEIQLAKDRNRPLHISHAPLRNQEGAITGSIMVLSDISDLRHTQAELSQSQASYQTLVEIAPEAILHLDMEGHIQYHNQRLSKLTGFSESELKDLSLEELVVVEDRDALQQLFGKHTPEGGFPYTFQVRLRTKQGSLRHVEISTAAMERLGMIEGITAFVRDDTQRHAAERQVQEARALAEFSSDLLSHDINNLNQGIKGYLELLQTIIPEGEKAHEYAQAAINQVEASNQLIQNVRTLLDIRGQAPKLRPVEAVELLKALLERMQGNYTNLPFEYHLELPEEGLVRADGLLGELFLNLLDNGVKYNTSEKPKLEIAVGKGDLPQGPAWLFSIGDNGPGIPDEQKRLLLDPAVRNRASKKGWGLGLSLVRALVDRYEGRIWIEDRKKGSGAVFKVLLPMATVPKKVVD